ncbi:MAG: hypothetical protein FJX76_22565 [Armatimonadetes bacterium]|nr:hypothetical protein [Armatimonadota bacterium]
MEPFKALAATLFALLAATLWLTVGGHALSGTPFLRNPPRPEATSDPRDARFLDLFHLGCQQAASGQQAAALATLRRAAHEARPQDAQSISNCNLLLAILSMENGRRKDARSHLRAARRTLSDGPRNLSHDVAILAETIWFERPLDVASLAAKPRDAAVPAAYAAHLESFARHWNARDWPAADADLEMAIQQLGRNENVQDRARFDVLVRPPLIGLLTVLRGDLSARCSRDVASTNFYLDAMGVPSVKAAARQHLGRETTRAKDARLDSQALLAGVDQLLRTRSPVLPSNQMSRLFVLLETIDEWEQSILELEDDMWSVFTPAQRRPIVAAIRRMRETRTWQVGLPRPASVYMEAAIRLAERRSGVERPPTVEWTSEGDTDRPLEALTAIDGQPYEVACVLPRLDRAGTVQLDQEQWEQLLECFTLVDGVEKKLLQAYVRLDRMFDESQIMALEQTLLQLPPPHNDLQQHVRDVLRTLRARKAGAAPSP